ncbi:hypothetical protein SH528x_002963 [Novipirellula sp. SH528]|uniref:hypothetical protein n=1 Tax=Novipirellula sp. SH528 TaxID=3454466 RepID=UPI003FA117E4
MTLLDRFRSGDCEQVWRLIVDERRPADDPEAVEVAQETVRRARDNLRTIYERLIELSYAFAEPDDAFVTTTPEEAAEEISAVEMHYGPLPGLARIWYSHIHSVNFTQTETQGRDPDHDLRNLGMNPQAIYLPLSRCQKWGLENHAQYVEWYKKMKSTELDGFDTIDYLNRCCKTPDESARFLPLGSCASNNENKGFTLPCDMVDAEFFNDGEVTHFNEDLRYVIMSGCFPGLGSIFYRENAPEFMRFGHPDPESLRAYLTSNLQPL